MAGWIAWMLLVMLAASFLIMVGGARWGRATAQQYVLDALRKGAKGETEVLDQVRTAQTDDEKYSDDAQITLAIDALIANRSLTVVSGSKDDGSRVLALTNRYEEQRRLGLQARLHAKS